MHNKILTFLLLLCVFTTMQAQNPTTTATVTKVKGPTTVTKDGDRTITTTTTKTTIKVTTRPYSLCSILVRSAALDDRESIRQAFVNLLPETSFNNFNLPERFLNLDEYENLTTEASTSKVKSFFKKFKKGARIGATLLGYKLASEQVKADMDKMPSASEQFFQQHNVAARLDSAWQNNDTLKWVAKTLEGNTYVMVSMIRFRPIAELADDVMRTARIAGKVTGVGLATGALTKTATNMAVDAITGEGYCMYGNALVYQLVKEDDVWTLKYRGTLKARTAERQKKGGDKSDDELMFSATDEILQTLAEQLEDTIINGQE